MDDKKINPEDFLSIVTDVRLLQWGSELQIECLDDPIDRQPYVLVFKNCREIKWTVLEPDPLLEPDRLKETEADLIGVLPGQPSYQEPAIINAGIFEVSVLYENFEVQKRIKAERSSDNQDL